MEQVAPGVFIDTHPVSILGMDLTTTMTALEVTPGEVLVHSPIPATPARIQEVRALGKVAHLYSPNTFHHMWLAQWAEQFPDAQVHGPSGLKETLHRRHDREPSPFGDSLAEVRIEGFRLQETALFHRHSGTLVVADVVHNVGRPADPWTRLYTQTMGFYDQVALSRVIRWTAFHDTAAAARSVDRLLELPIQRIVVGHGTPVTEAPAAALRQAWRWARR